MTLLVTSWGKPPNSLSCRHLRVLGLDAVSSAKLFWSRSMRPLTRADFGAPRNSSLANCIFLLSKHPVIKALSGVPLAICNAARSMEVGIKLDDVEASGFIRAVANGEGKFRADDTFVSAGMPVTGYDGRRKFDEKTRESSSSVESESDNEVSDSLACRVGLSSRIWLAATAGGRGGSEEPFWQRLKLHISGAFCELTRGFERKLTNSDLEYIRHEFFPHAVESDSRVDAGTFFNFWGWFISTVVCLVASRISRRFMHVARRLMHVAPPNASPITRSLAHVPPTIESCVSIITPFHPPSPFLSYPTHFIKCSLMCTHSGIDS